MYTYTQVNVYSKHVHMYTSGQSKLCKHVNVNMYSKHVNVNIYKPIYICLIRFTCGFCGLLCIWIMQRICVHDAYVTDPKYLLTRVHVYMFSNKCTRGYTI